MYIRILDIKIDMDTSVDTANNSKTRSSPRTAVIIITTIAHRMKRIRIWVWMLIVITPIPLLLVTE